MNKTIDAWANLAFHYAEQCDLLDFCPICRSNDKHDFEIIRARTLATKRGATPAEIQSNVEKLSVY